MSLPCAHLWSVAVALMGCAGSASAGAGVAGQGGAAATAVAAAPGAGADGRGRVPASSQANYLLESDGAASLQSAPTAADLGRGQLVGYDGAVHPYSVSYLGGWRWSAVEASAALTVLRNTSTNTGGGYGGPEDFTRARAGTSVSYNIVRLAASISRALPRDWQLRAVVKGQYASDALTSGEPYDGYGTAAVRGYAEREIADDIGLAGNLELYTPNLCGALPGWSCRALGFYDSGYLKRNRELAGELRSSAVGSVGLGVRMLLTRRVNLQLDYGHVVRANAMDGLDVNRVHLRMSLAY